MTGWASVLAAALVAVPTVGAGQDPVPGARQLTFDDAVYESSGLVDRGAVVYTVNDSGDDAVVYGVDARTGATLTRTTYADEARDVEALAPGRDGRLWVGDIGDNRRARESVVVHRLRPRDGEVDARSFELTYPDGPRDAEALLVHPRTQRLYIVTKSPFGGTVYVAPRRLRDGANRLREFARLSGGLVTDGAFTPDGRRVLLRTYSEVSLRAFPAFTEIDARELPYQEQGEGISVSASRRVLISTEGVAADVLRLRLPPAWLAPPRDPAPAPAPAPARPAAGSDERGVSEWLGVGLVAAGVVGLGWLTLRASRIRSR